MKKSANLISEPNQSNPRKLKSLDPTQHMGQPDPRATLAQNNNVGIVIAFIPLPTTNRIHMLDCWKDYTEAVTPNLFSTYSMICEN